jgi:thiamine-monophosphate kinase
MDEFQLIQRFFSPLSRLTKGSVRLGVGDDGAVLAPPPGCDLVMATDTVLAGVHFPMDCPPRAIAHRALAVNLSDLAAMAADPLWYTLALSLPAASTRWLSGFSKGLERLSGETGIALVGGDTVRGPLAVTITVVGSVPRGRAVTRVGARPGDWICVTGPLGRAAAGLSAWRKGQRRGATLLPFLYPRPALEWVPLLREFAHSALDVSDGLIQDLGHLLRGRPLGAVIDLDRLDCEPRDLGGLKRALSGGDDYVLCFTVAPRQWTALQRRVRARHLDCRMIGQIVPGAGIRYRGEMADRIRHTRIRGYDHFQKIPLPRRHARPDAH